MTLKSLDIAIQRILKILISGYIPLQIYAEDNFYPHHPQTVKRGVVKCLHDRAKKFVTRPNATVNVKQRLASALISNGYPSSFLQKVTKTRPAVKKEPTNYKSFAVLPYTEGVSQTVRRCLQDHGIKTVFKSDTTLRSQLVRPKDPVPKYRKDGVVYKIPCS